MTKNGSGLNHENHSLHLANSLATTTREPQTRRERKRWVGGGESVETTAGANTGWMRQFCRKPHEFPN